MLFAFGVSKVWKRYKQLLTKSWGKMVNIIDSAFPGEIKNENLPF